MANNQAFKIKNGLQAGRYLQSSTALSASDVDLSTGSYFSKTLSANTTFTFSNPPASGKGMWFLLNVTGNGSTITWPSSVKWPDGTAPDAPSSGDKNIYTFVTTDGGTTYYGKLAGESFA